MLMSVSRSAAPIVLTPEERATLGAWGRGRRLAYRKVVRAKIITLAGDGVESQEIAKLLGVSRPTVQLWRQRFLALRVAGLEKMRPGPAARPRYRRRRSTRWSRPRCTRRRPRRPTGR